MKSLYESILSTNNASLLNDVKEWIEGILNINIQKRPDFSIDIQSSKQGLDIVLNGFNPIYIVIDNRFLKNGDLPFPIHSIKNQSRMEVHMVMRECNIYSFKNFPHHHYIKFLGCAIEDLSSLPDSYKKILFQHSNSLSGGRVNYIAKCEGLKLDEWLGDGESYSLVTDRFKNNTIKDFCLCGAGFVENVDWNDVISRIVDNNNIDYKDITVMFYNQYKHAKINRGRVEKKKVDGSLKYVVVKDSNMHKEIPNGKY